jgi:hypothetical protein
MTRSTRCAAVSDMRRAPHEGQNPRRLQLNASSLSWPHSPQRTLGKPGQDAAFEESFELVLDELRQLGVGVGDEAGRMMLHQAVQPGPLRGWHS